MSETNGGSLSSAERFDRLETQLTVYQSEVRQSLAALNDRITRHKETNQEHVRQLSNDLVKSYESRISTLETTDAQNVAVQEYQEKAASSRRWLIGIGISVILGLIAQSIALINLLGKVN